MREILFRGKSVNLHNGSKDFVYGQYVQNRDGEMIYSDTWEDGKQKHYVIEETVGQYTGLTDKNGKKIFEGDIIKDIEGRINKVEYYRGRFYPFISFPEYTCWDSDECEVIGNIHDNPELLEGGEG